jgi:hypothetical protein
MFNPTEKLRTNFLWERFHEDDNRARTGKQLCTKDNGPATVGGVPTGASRVFLTQGCLPASLYGASAYGTVNSSGTLTGLLGNIFGFTSGDVNTGDTTSTDLQSIETSLDPLYQSKSNTYQFTLNYDLSDELSVTAMTSYGKGNVYTKQDYNRNISTVPFNNTPFTPGGFFNDPQVGNTNKFTTIDISSGRSEQFSQELRLQSNYRRPAELQHRRHPLHLSDADRLLRDRQLADAVVAGPELLEDRQPELQPGDHRQLHRHRQGGHARRLGPQLL